MPDEDVKKCGTVFFLAYLNRSNVYTQAIFGQYLGGRHG